MLRMPFSAACSLSENSSLSFRTTVSDWSPLPNRDMLLFYTVSRAGPGGGRLLLVLDFKFLDEELGKEKRLLLILLVGPAHSLAHQGHYHVAANAPRDVVSDYS